MSTTITGIYGSTWRIDKPSDDVGCVAIDSRQGSGNRVFKVADVLSAMKTEGVLDAVEIITELPEVRESPVGGRVRVGIHDYGYSVDDAWEDGSKHREAALRSLALARYCEAKHAKKVAEEELEAIKQRAAEATLDARRNVVALKIGAHPNYKVLTDVAQSSIDLIIALEDQLAAK